MLLLREKCRQLSRSSTSGFMVTVPAADSPEKALEDRRVPPWGLPANPGQVAPT